MSAFGVILMRIFPHLDWIRSISPYSVQMRENTDQNKSEHGNSSHSGNFTKKLYFRWYLSGSYMQSWIYKIQTQTLLVRASRREVFCKKSVLKDFAKFSEKHLCQNLFFNKAAVLSPAALLKRGTGISVFLWILRIF